MSNFNRSSETVETVLGPVSLSKLGKTLTHEHISCDFSKYYMPPEETYLDISNPGEMMVYKMSSKIRNIIHEKITLKNLSELLMFPYIMEYNTRLNDIDSKLNSLNELYLFNHYGGKTIVESSSYGLQRDTSSLKAISKETGVNIIVGTGYYTAISQINSFQKQSTEMYDLMCSELIIGCSDDQTVKPGFIGEIGVGLVHKPYNIINIFERNSIYAAALAQRQFDCPVSLSSGFCRNTAKAVMRIFLEAGGNCNKVAMCYVDRALARKEDLLDFADAYKNCYLQFSSFGTEGLVITSEGLMSQTAMLSDAQRIKRIKKLKENKYLDRVLISHNIHTKHKLRNFGGHGYSYILTNTRNHMLKNGLTETDFDTILEDNPKSWLRWNKGQL